MKNNNAVKGASKHPATRAAQAHGRAGKQKPMTPSEVVERKISKSMDKWTQGRIAYNQNTIKRLCEMADKDEHYVVRDILDAAIPKILPGYRREEIFNAVSAVFDCSWRGGRRESIGFYNGKLVACNGKTIKPITLVQSVMRYAKLNASWTNTSTSSNGAVAKWCSMIAKAL